MLYLSFAVNFVSSIIHSVEPRHGSLAGGTNLVIKGTGIYKNFDLSFTCNAQIQHSELMSLFRCFFQLHQNFLIKHVASYCEILFYLDFSDDQYSKLNEVFLINTKTQAVLTCGIIVTDTTSQRISCETV